MAAPCLSFCSFHLFSSQAIASVSIVEIHIEDMNTTLDMCIELKMHVHGHAPDECVWTCTLTDGVVGRQRGQGGRQHTPGAFEHGGHMERLGQKHTDTQP